jgi:hypothetical protein
MSQLFYIGLTYWTAQLSKWESQSCIRQNVLGEYTLLALHNSNSSNNCLRSDKFNYLIFQLIFCNKNLTYFNSSNDYGRR